MDKDCNCAIFQYGTCINCGKPAFTGNPTKTNGEGQIDRIPALLAEIEELNCSLVSARDACKDKDAVIEELKREKDDALNERISPLIIPTEEATKVFRAAKEHEPDMDMRAVPNGWLLKERALSQQFAARAEAAESREKDLAAWAEIIVENLKEIQTTGEETKDSWLVEVMTKLLSLPLPGSAQRGDEEVRREAFEEAIRIVNDEQCGLIAEIKMAYRIVKKLRAACEKGESNVQR